MGNYTKVKNIMLYVLNNAEYLSFMNHVLDLANGNSGGGDSESPDEISLLTGSDGIPGPVPSRWRPSVTRASTYTRSSSPITASPAFPWRRRPPR